VICGGAAVGSVGLGVSVEACTAFLPSGSVGYWDWGHTDPISVAIESLQNNGNPSKIKSAGFGGVGAGFHGDVGFTNATKESDLGGYFNTQTLSAGNGPGSGGITFSYGENGAGDPIYIVLFGWTPGIASPVNYSNLNTYTSFW
jgi:hypothetical protein